MRVRRDRMRSRNILDVRHPGSARLKNVSSIAELAKKNPLGSVVIDLMEQS
jgi:hypothetical protein